jgi:glycosyltransferase involved in cell wall biosynthesis
MMAENDAPLPTVTVVLPSRNESAYIGMAIASIRRQCYPAELIEIIVVDNGSTDRSVEVAQAAGATVHTRLNCRVGAVRNEGAKYARGEVLAFLDSDCEADEFWLADAIALLYSADRVGLVGGTYRAPANGLWIERAWAPVEAPTVAQDVDFLACSGLVVKRETFDRLRGFDEVLEAAEDDDFSKRVRELGLRVVSAPRCSVVHHGYPKTLYGIARRQFWHGSNQLESSVGIRDILLMFTHLFLLGEILLVGGALLGSGRMWWGLALMLVLVALSSVNRVRKHGYGRDSPTEFLQVCLVVGAYFSGRSIGLVNNYVKNIKGRLGLRV